MVMVMGLSSALRAVVPTVYAGVRCQEARLRSSLDGVHGGHGFQAASPIATTKCKFEPLANVVARRNRSRRGREELLATTFGKRETRDLRVLASSSDESSSGEKGQVKTEDVPGWAKANSDELPPWAKNERPASQEPAKEIPFPVYLIGSTLVSIAAVGSVFEYFNKNPVFGVVSPDSPFYAPILGFFAFTGLPTAGFLFYKSIQLANKASEEADREDGYRR